MEESQQSAKKSLSSSKKKKIDEDEFSSKIKSVNKNNIFNGTRIFVEIFNNSKDESRILDDKLIESGAIVFFRNF